MFYLLSKKGFSNLFLSLALVQLCCTISYYGTQTLLVLYLINDFHFSINQSYVLYGGFVALLFTLPTLGGIIADRFTGPRNAFLFGSLLAVIGNFLLSIQGHFVFALGLAFLIVGAGLAKSSSLAITGFLHQDHLVQKEQAFSFLYVITNIGATLGPLLYGLIAYSWGWNKGFLLSGAALLLATLLFLLMSRNSNISVLCPKRKQLWLYPACLPVAIFIAMLFYFPKILDPLIASLFIVSLIYITRVIFKEKAHNRKALFSLMLLSFFGMFYYIAGMQVGSTIAVFIQQKINIGAIRFDLPASVFASLYTVLIVIFAPCVNILWRYLATKGINVTLAHKLAIGSRHLYSNQLLHPSAFKNQHDGLVASLCSSWRLFKQPIHAFIHTSIYPHNTC